MVQNDLNVENYSTASDSIENRNQTRTPKNKSVIQNAKNLRKTIKNKRSLCKSTKSTLHQAKNDQFTHQEDAMATHKMLQKNFNIFSSLFT